MPAARRSLDVGNAFHLEQLAGTPAEARDAETGDDGLGSGNRSSNIAFTAGQFFSRSTSDTLILRTLAIDVPAFSRLSFIISSASPNCCRASPGPSGRRSGYQPPMPPTNVRFPERIGPPTRCLPGRDAVPCAAIFLVTWKPPFSSGVRIAALTERGKARAT